MTTQLTTDADRQELLDSLRPGATRMRSMLAELLSVDGMRISDHGHRKYTYDAFRRAQRAAVHRGFILERLPAGPHGRIRNVIVQRWEPPYRDGAAALLEWSGEADLEVASALANNRRCELTTDLLAVLAREPSLACLLPPLPGAVVGHDNDTVRWQSWCESAYAVIDVVTS